LRVGGRQPLAEDRSGRCRQRTGVEQRIGGPGVVTGLGVDGEKQIAGEPQALEYSVTPAGGEPFVVTATVPPKFNSITATGAPAGFVNATLRCAPHHTFRIFSSTDLHSWHPATISGAPAGPDQNLFNPRGAALWSASTHAAPLALSKEGQSKLFFLAKDEVTGDATTGETP
jgi:hypothetical protein